VPQFVTVATFNEVPKAEIARNILAEGGIKSYLSDSELVAMDWLIANAIGGVKVQVASEDAERALEVLAEAKEMQASLVDDRIDDDELARQAMAESPEDEDDVSNAEEAPTTVLAPPPSVESPQAPAPSEDVSERDRNAKRAFVLGWFGLALPPVACIALYFFVASALGTGTLTPRGRYNLWVSAILVVPAAIIAAVFFSFFMR
jgi:hypothetical protein